MRAGPPDDWRLTPMVARFNQITEMLRARARQPTFWAAVGVATVAYFTSTRLLQDWLYRDFQRPADLFESFGEKFVNPEPWEIPLYFAGYAFIPLLALTLQWAVARWWPVVRRYRTFQWLLVAVVVLAAGALARRLPWGDWADFAASAVAYVKTRGIGRALWLLLTKRLFVSTALVLVALAVFLVAAVVPRWQFKFTPLPSLERWLSRHAWLLVALVALLVVHPNFPSDYHHANYFTAPVNDQLLGKPLLYETNNLYGILNHYLLLAVFGLGLLTFTYPAFSLVVAIFFLGFLVGIFFVLKSWLRSPTYAAAATFALYALLYLFQVSPTRSPYHFPANTPFRFWLVVPVLAFLVRFGRTRSPRPAAAAVALSVAALFWNFETGLAIAAATLLTLLAAAGRQYLRAGSKLLAAFFAWGLGAFAAISTTNWLAYGRLPDWLTYAKEIGEFARGVAMYPLPALGLYTLLVIVALAVALRQLFRLPGELLDVPLLFTALYSAFAMIHYVGESTWQRLFMAAWPSVVLMVVLASRLSTRRDIPHQRLVGAALLAGAVFFAGWYAVKLPIELQSRSYPAISQSLWAIPSEEAALVRDAEVLRREFPNVRLPLVHINDAKLLHYARKTNWFPVYYSFTLYYRSQVVRLAELVARQQPPFVLLGNGSDARDNFQRARGQELLAFFRPLLPAGYVLDRRLETLDIYRRQ